MLGLFLGGLASALGTIASQGMANKRAEQDRAQNYWLNEMSAAAADARTRKLYQDLQSPEALLEQYRKAGLSPSLMLGNGGGVSGQVSQGAQGAGSNGLQTQMFGFTPLDAAQADLARAQAEKIRTETKFVAPTAEANIEELLKRAGAHEAASAYSKSLTTYQNTQNYIADKTKDFSISKVRYEAEIAKEKATQAFWEAENSGLEFRFNLETFEKRKEELANEVALLAERIALTHEQKELTIEQKNAIIETVKQGWAEIGVKAMSASAYMEYVDLEKETLPEQLRLRAKEINLESWKIGVDAVTSLVQTGLYIYGMSQFGRVGQGGLTQPNPKQVMKGASRQWTPARHGAGGRWTEK